MSATLQPNSEIRPATAPRLLTSGCIAAALGISKQALRKALAAVAPCNKVDVKGQPTPAWTLAALPQSIRQRLAVIAQQRNTTVEELVANPPQPFAAPVPFTQLPEAAQIEAFQWREILSPLLARQHTTPPAELLADGLSAAQRVLGASLSDDTLRRRFDLAVERDNSFEQWQNLNLYVTPAAYQAAQRATEAACAPVVVVPPSDLWPDLPDRLDELENKLDPTAEDRAHLLDAAFRQLETLLDANVGTLREPKLKRRLCELLLQAVPALSKSLSALQRTFDRLLTRWRVNGRTPAAILDARDNSGRTAKKLCAACREQVKGAAVELDGDLAQAWRRLKLTPSLGGIRANGKGLCDTCDGLWHYNVRHNKSYVPASVRSDLTAEIESVLIERHGRKAAKLASPYVRRDWSDIGPGDRQTADDQTPNHVTFDALLYSALPDGQYWIGCVECLAGADERTDYPLGYLIKRGTLDDAGKVIKAHYSSADIRKLFLHINDQVGLPHIGYTLENSVWAARLIDGEPQRGWELNPWRRTEHGLRDPRLGLEIRHAEPGNPRTKIIERIFGTVQNRMRPQAGFVGFNQRTDKREAVQDFIRRAKTGKEHPGNELHSLESFTKLLDEEFMAFAREPQNGDRLPGVSPLEAWQNGIGGKPGIMDRPLRKLEDSDRALLSTHRRTVSVTGQGIRLRIPGQQRPAVFWGDALIPYKNREIEVAINLEEPGLLHCLPKNGEFFTLRERVLPSSTATREQLAETSAARRRWMKAGKIAFDNLPHPLRTSITRDTEDTNTKAEGDFINAETAAHREATQQLERHQKRLQQRAQAVLGSPVATPNTQTRAMDIENALQRKQARQPRLAEIEAKSHTP